MSHQLSPLASIDPSAQIEADVAIGPYCVIGPRVHIHSGCRLENHVTITGNVTLGGFNHVFPGVVIGQGADDLSDPTTSREIVIGANNIIREKATILPGTMPTTVGNHNLLMACCHIGRDCQLSDHITVANGCVLGKGVVVGDFAAFSGRVAVRENVTVGCYSFSSIASHIVSDVPPFVIVEGSPARPRSLNRVSLLRNGFSVDAIKILRIAYRLCFRSNANSDQARKILNANLSIEPRLSHLLRFIEQL